MKRIYMIHLSCVLLLIMTSCLIQEEAILTENIIVDKDIQNESKSVNQIGNHILNIFEDSQGYLWFGTVDKGVARYDGHELQYFTKEDGLCGKTVANIIEDNDGFLWFGTHSDMCKYDQRAIDKGKKGSFLKFDKDSAGVPLLGYGWKQVQTDRKGDVWVNSHHGIFQYSNASFKEFKVPITPRTGGSFCNTPGIVSMDLEDSQGNLWFGTDGYGVYKYDGKAFVHYTKEDGLLSDNISKIVEDKNGNIWFACINGINSMTKEDGGVCSFDGREFMTYQDIEGLYNNNIFTIYSDTAENIWIGATGVGVYKHNGSTFTFYQEPEKVCHTATGYSTGLQSILEDSKGRLWMGFSGGLYRLDGNSFSNVTVDGPWS